MGVIKSRILVVGKCESDIWLMTVKVLPGDNKCRYKFLTRIEWCWSKVEPLSLDDSLPTTQTSKPEIKCLFWKSTEFLVCTVTLLVAVTYAVPCLSPSLSPGSPPFLFQVLSLHRAAQL